MLAGATTANPTLLCTAAGTSTRHADGQRRRLHRHGDRERHLLAGARGARAGPHQRGRIERRYARRLGRADQRRRHDRRPHRLGIPRQRSARTPSRSFRPGTMLPPGGYLVLNEIVERRGPVRLRPRRRRFGEPLRSDRRDRRDVQLDGARGHHVRALPERNRGRSSTPLAPRRARRTTAPPAGRAGRAARRARRARPGRRARRARRARPARRARRRDGRRRRGRRGRRGGRGRRGRNGHAAGLAGRRRGRHCRRREPVHEQPVRAELRGGDRRESGRDLGDSERPVDAVPPGLRRHDDDVGQHGHRRLGRRQDDSLPERHGRPGLRGRHDGRAGVVSDLRVDGARQQQQRRQQAVASCASTPARPGPR